MVAARFFAWRSDVALPLSERHCTVMQMLRRSGSPRTGEIQERTGGSKGQPHGVHLAAPHFFAFLGHTPSTALGLSGGNSGKIPERPRKRSDRALFKG